MIDLLKKMIVIGCLSCLSAMSYAEEELYLLGETISQDKQQNMTPKQALLRLKDGNQRFITNKQLSRDYLAQAHESSYGQYPYAIVLNCMDSRSVPEFIFDQGLADLFTLRVAGNVVNDDILGSMEFGAKVVGARLIVVLAHTECGAVAGACSGAELGHLTDVLDKIKPVVSMTMRQEKLKNCTDPKLVNAIARANALQVVKEIQEKSPILKKLVENQQIGIVAGLHDIKTGKVFFFEEARSVPKTLN